MASLRAWAAGLRAAQRGSDSGGAAAAAPSAALAGCGVGDGDAWDALVGGGRPARQDHAEGHAAAGTLYCTGHQVSCSRCLGLRVGP
jgi:hypothetical protein